ncbi:MAG: DUF6916 family protein [Bacteroidales bacterium]
MDKRIAVGELRLEHFSGRIGEAFLVPLPDRVETLVLDEAEARKTGNAALTMRPGFSIIFRGSSPDLLLNQGIFALRHEELGRLELFMVPIGQLPDGNFRYQACFG